MNYTVSKPAMPVLWLDTHAIANIALALDKPKSDNTNIYLRKLFEKIVKLRLEKKIISFESDQLTELEVRPELLRTTTKVLSQTSQGLVTHYQLPMKAQERLAMQSALGSVSTCNVAFQTAFHDDPMLDQTVDGLIISARMRKSADAIVETQQTNKSISEIWEQMRVANAAEHEPEKIRIAKHAKLEALTTKKMFESVFKRSMALADTQQPTTEEDIFQYLEIVKMPGIIWQQLGGSNSAKGISDFYSSDYYLELPFLDIQSKLTAYKITGTEKIKPSDVMDIHNISAFMPYCNLMVLDKAMIHAVKKLGLDTKYGTKVLTIRELSSALPS